MERRLLMPEPEPFQPDSIADLSDEAVRALLSLGSVRSGELVSNHEFPEIQELERRLSGYAVTAFIGRGGMGAVYHGVQRSLEREASAR